MKQKRNMSVSDLVSLSMPEAVWSRWTVNNAVKEGYTVSGWVYRAINMIAKNGASVPWGVANADDGTFQDKHPLKQVLNKPNPFFSRQDFFELILSWQQLAGKGYAKRVIVQNRTQELWPISPDRLAPIQSKEPGALLTGYELLDSKGARKKTTDFTVDNTVAFKLLNPANPLEGIGPLQAVARAVDIDVEQQKWNKSAMQNRGVLDGIFSFDRDLDVATFDTIKAKLAEMFSFGGSKKARGPGVIGSNAKYQQLSLSPVEMDFLNSRKFNREEIFIIFGVPPQLAGVQDSSTFNNYATSLRIFWEATVLPALDDLADTFNMAFYDELEQGKFVIAYDTTRIAALRENEDDKAKTAKVYFDMGVPVENLNARFELNLEPYTGWELPWGGAKPQLTGTTASGVTDEARKKPLLKPLEQRNIQDEIDKKEKVAQGSGSRTMRKMLDAQREAVFKALNENADIQGAIVATQDDMIKAFTELYLNTAILFADTVVIEERASDDGTENRAISLDLQQAIAELLTVEGVILTELSLINRSTVDKILAIIVDAEGEGATPGAIQQAIIDSGTFGPERALRIARTSVGTAQSLGQMSAAREAGATQKTWVDSGFEVRVEHSNRDGETVGLNERFSSQFQGFPAPRWPLDQNIAAADRINCRCSMTFS